MSSPSHDQDCFFAYGIVKASGNSAKAKAQHLSHNISKVRHTLSEKARSFLFLRGIPANARDWLHGDNSRKSRKSSGEESIVLACIGVDQLSRHKPIRVGTMVRAGTAQLHMLLILPRISTRTQLPASRASTQILAFSTVQRPTAIATKRPTYGCKEKRLQAILPRTFSTSTKMVSSFLAPRCQPPVS